MNVSDVKIRVRKTFGDEASVQVTDSDILTWINDGQREVVMHNPELLEKIVTTDALQETQDYPFPIDLLQLRSIAYRTDSTTSYFRLIGKSLQEFDRLIDGWDGPSLGLGTPRFYCAYNNIVKLFPIPDIASTNGIKLYYYRLPTDVSLDTDVLDLPISYHGAVVEYCLKQAYEMDEDWTSVGNKAQEFNASVEGQKAREKGTNTEYYPTITILPEDRDWDCY
jgi:uncharacterized protein DUF6682